MPFATSERAVGLETKAAGFGTVNAKVPVNVAAAFEPGVMVPGADVVPEVPDAVVVVAPGVADA